MANHPITKAAITYKKRMAKNVQFIQASKLEFEQNIKVQSEIIANTVQYKNYDL